MAGLFNRLKVWAGLEVIQNVDLNAEFDNIINNLSPSGISGWESSVAQMQLQTSPGTFGSESLATSMNGELERIRYQLNAIIGGSDSVWYDQPSVSLSQIKSALPTIPPTNRIVSSAVVGTSQQPLFLIPSGSTASVTLKCSVTPLTVFINGTSYTFTQDYVLSSLSTAPATNNTFAINDSNCDLSNKTKGFGSLVYDFGANADNNVWTLSEYPIIGNTVGTSISNLSGSYQAFSYTHSAITEYFTAWINPGAASTIVNLSKAQRGFFFNSSSAGVPPVALNNTESVTLMQLIWLYVTTAGALIAVYTHPRYSPVQPTSSSSGDMWFDTVNQTWKQSNGSTYASANATLVGVAVTNSSNCIAARSFDWYRGYGNASNVVPEFYSTSEYRTKYDNNIFNVYGNVISFDKDTARWQSSNVESGTSLTNSTTYFLYLSETGAPYISQYAPLRRFDIGGFYHPYNSWRCCGMFFYNGSGQFSSSSILSFSNLSGDFLNDKSVSISKKKASPFVIYDANAVTPVVAQLDQISLSTVAVLSTGSSSVFANIQDTNTKNITCSLVSSGGAVLIGLVPDYLAIASQGITFLTTSNTTAIGCTIELYIDGVVCHDAQSFFTSGTTMVQPWSIPLPSSLTFNILMNVAPGAHTYTAKYKVSGTGNTLSISNIRLMVKEI